MSVVRGTVKNGKIVLDSPPGWPDGTEVEVRSTDQPAYGCTEDEQGDDPVSIEAWIAWLKSLQPIILTPEDKARIAAARQAQREFELSTWDQETEKARKLFE